MNPYVTHAIEYVLKNEGGFVFDPDDAGGPTNFGITQADLSLWLKEPASIEEIKNLSVVEAQSIYFAHFWLPLGLDAINPVAVSTAILDTRVLHGPYVATSFAQKALNACGATLKIDGHLGPVSFSVLNSVDVKKFVESYVTFILARIDSVVASKPKDEKFRSGWTDRTKRLLTLV